MPAGHGTGGSARCSAAASPRRSAAPVGRRATGRGQARCEGERCAPLCLTSRPARAQVQMHARGLYGHVCGRDEQDHAAVAGDGMHDRSLRHPAPGTPHTLHPGGIVDGAHRPTSRPRMM